MKSVRMARLCTVAMVRGVALSLSFFRTAFASLTASQRARLIFLKDRSVVPRSNAWPTRRRRPNYNTKNLCVINLITISFQLDCNQSMWVSAAELFINAPPSSLHSVYMAKCALASDTHTHTYHVAMLVTNETKIIIHVLMVRCVPTNHYFAFFFLFLISTHVFAISSYTDTNRW